MTALILAGAVLAFATVAAIAWPLFGKSGKDGGRAKIARVAALGSIGLTPVAAALLYGFLGAPEALVLTPAQEMTPEDPAAAIAAMAPEERAEMIEAMVEGLSARLEADPDDLQGWRMLARSYGVLGRHEEAAAAWREAAARSGGAVDDWRGLATAMIEQRAEDGANAPAIKAAFEEVLEREPDDPLALYFLGHAARAEGNMDRARDLWTRLRAATPPGSPVTDELDSLIASVSDQ